MTDHNKANEDQLGEGFAFFRWHVLTFATSECSYPDRDNICAGIWDEMQTEALAALKEVQP